MLRLLLAPLLMLMLGFSATGGELVDGVALDKLFAQLKVAPTEEQARQIDERIWFYWMTPTDPALAGRMKEALAARALGDTLGAIRLLDEIVADYPDYAEAWNQRATMYYVIGNFEASIADCAKVLELEPRHFGALSGRALMYLQMGKRALALKDMAAALAIHPFLTERQLFPEFAHPATQI
jgi:tetratricopeptide (TPR) repeat protein